MSKNKHYLRFCGIDVAKNKHVVCLIDHDGQQITKPRTIANTSEGFSNLLNCLKLTGKAKSILIGMEATGHYWYSLHDFLANAGYDVVVLNPIQTAAQVKQAVRKRKTDKHDAFHIAALLKSGQHKAAVIPREQAMHCRELTRGRHRLVKQISMTKQILHSKLHPVWPEYEKLFNDVFGAASIKLLKRYSTPQEILNTDFDEVYELLRRSSRGHYGLSRTEILFDSARKSVGFQRGLDGISATIKFLLEEIESLNGILRNFDDQINSLAESLPAYLFTLPGATNLSIVSLFGEIGEITAFSNPSQLTAFAGLDPKVYQSGQYDAPNRKISKRGSPYLRQTLWQMAFRATFKEGLLKDYFWKKRKEGKHHLVAITACANKLCKITWRIMTEQRDYIQKI